VLEDVDSMDSKRLTSRGTTAMAVTEQSGVGDDQSRFCTVASRSN
jgi:hypothetical protein